MLQDVDYKYLRFYLTRSQIRVYSPTFNPYSFVMCYVDYTPSSTGYGVSVWFFHCTPKFGLSEVSISSSSLSYTLPRVRVVEPRNSRGASLPNETSVYSFTGSKSPS